MKILYIKSLIMGILIVMLSCAKDKPRILIIGDSISIGYTPFVIQNLSNIADVFHNPGNAQHTGNGLKKIDEWIGNEQWDIIQFNWGLWDLCYRSPESMVQGNRDKVKGTITYTISEYASNLDSLVTKIKSKSKAKLIFVTTTYVPENEAGRFENDAIKYNEVAKEVMRNHSVLVNDIYGQSIPIHKELGKGSDDVHYSNQGYERLAEVVSRFLRNEIE